MLQFLLIIYNFRIKSIHNYINKKVELKPLQIHGLHFVPHIIASNNLFLHMQANMGGK